MISPLSTYLAPYCNGVLYNKLPNKEKLFRQVLHGCAKTTTAVRIAIKNSKESLVALAKKYSVNPKTVAKWKKRQSAQDSFMGPKNPHSTVLTLEEEAICVKLFANIHYCLLMIVYIPCKLLILKLTRSSLHRLFVRK